ncbi:hypothetical protein [Actinacidiphila acidipaludis]|nr:hypothetical protein [Streptomyces acidipaludis]
MLGSLLALAGAVAAVWSPFRAWYGGRHGSGIRVDDLFTGVGVTPHGAALLGSLFLPMLFAALLTVLGVLLRSRLVIALAGVIVLGFTVLWMVRQAQFSHSLTAGGNGLDTGVAFAVLGGLLLCAAAVVLPGRNRPLHYAQPDVPLDRDGAEPSHDRPLPPSIPPDPYAAPPTYELPDLDPYAKPQPGHEPHSGYEPHPEYEPEPGYEPDPEYEPPPYEPPPPGR